MSATMRIEEVTVIGDFALTSYTRDFNDFKDFSDDYGVGFQTNFTQVLTDCKAVVSTRFHTGELKLITKKLYEDMDQLRPKLRRLEKYVKLAKDGLTVAVKDFGIMQVRKEMGRRDTEALSQRLKELFENIDDPTNNAALLAKGFKVPEYTVLKDLKTSIYDGNQEQNTLMNDRALAVQDNNALFKELTDIIRDVMDTGKVLYKGVDEAKVKEYTMSRLLNRIRQETDPLKEETNDVMTGCVVYVNYTDDEESELENVKTTIMEYAMEVNSDEEGVSYFENVPTSPNGKVTIKSELEGYLEHVQGDVELVAGGEVEISVTLVKIATDTDPA